MAYYNALLKTCWWCLFTKTPTLKKWTKEDKQKKKGGVGFRGKKNKED
jgi:hypothetical protein